MLKRNYEDLDPEDIDTDVDVVSPFSGMQTDVFDMLEEAGRVCVWSSEDELIDCVEMVP